MGSDHILLSPSPHRNWQPMAFSEEVSEFSTPFTSYAMDHYAMDQQLHAEDNSSAARNRNRSNTSQGKLTGTGSDFAQPPIRTHTKPLHIRKPSQAQLRAAPSMQHLDESKYDHGVSSSPIYPPRQSSHRNFTEFRDASPARSRENERQRHSETPSAYRYTASSRDFLSDTDVDASTPSMTNSRSTRSTGSSNNAQHHSGSTGIIGNFVPIDGSKMASEHASSSSGRKPSMDE